MGAPQAAAIGETIQVQPTIFPQSASGSTAIDGAAVDRFMGDASIAGSCVMSARTGASGGSPTSYIMTVAIEHSTAAGSGFAAFPSEDGQLTFTITADNSSNHLNIDLEGANQYIRAVLTPAYTGGTSPSTPVSADITLGGFSGGTAVPVNTYS